MQDLQPSSTPRMVEAACLRATGLITLHCLASVNPAAHSHRMFHTADSNPETYWISSPTTLFSMMSEDSSGLSAQPSVVNACSIFTAQPDTSNLFQDHSSSMTETSPQALSSLSSLEFTSQALSWSLPAVQSDPVLSCSIVPPVLSPSWFSRS